MKKRNKSLTNKSRQFGFNIKESWFQEILNLSLDSDLDKGECWAILRNYVPNIMSDILNTDSKEGFQEISSILTSDPTIQSDIYQNTTPTFEKEKCLPIDSDEE
mmetsp:Transcript_18080/g.20240  ORF Transcript_18080/g.20240 Transcript_18080/m.20240 type:complete len:104 (+) Transcript_18080:312-623(+)